MKNILLVFTGGTIGSIATKGTINTSNAMQFKLLEQFQQHYPDHQHIHFHTIQPIQLLSENLTPGIWTTLIAAIEAEHPKQYDGIIVTHGTDTLSYTAAALSFYFNAIKIPLLLVSSDYPLDDPRANGLINFICAIEFIVQKQQAGVFVPFRNQRQAMLLHSGVRLASSLQLSGDFFSVQNKSFMQFENRQFSLLNPIKKIEQPANYPLHARFSERVVMIKPYPGLNYDYFNLENGHVVLHDLYHSGTACTALQWGEQYSLLEFINCCQEKCIKVYLTPAIKSANAYDSTCALIQQGAEMIWNMSLEAAYVKLMLAYGNFNDQQQITDFMNTDIVGELIFSG